MIVAFSVEGLLELDGFKVGFIVTSWTILFLSIDIKDRCQGCLWFYQKRIGSRRGVLFVFLVVEDRCYGGALWFKVNDWGSMND